MFTMPTIRMTHGNPMALTISLPVMGPSKKCDLYDVEESCQMRTGTE